MSLFTENRYMLPGSTTLLENVEKEIIWGPMEVARAYLVPAVVDGSARDAGGSPTTLLRPGMLMGQLRSTEGTDPLKWKEWTPAATDGTQEIGGVLVTDLFMQRNAANQDRWIGGILTGGNIKASSILVPGQSSHGLSGQALEYYIRGVLGNRFLFDDYPHMHGGGSPIFPWKAITHKATDYTVLAADNGTFFTTKGATGAVEFTLPAITASQGMRFMFYAAADENLTVSSAAAGDLICLNDLTADGVTLSTSGHIIGSSFEVIGMDNASWLVIPHLADDGVIVTVTSV